MNLRMRKVGTAYLFWLGGLFGLAGLHRLYSGRIRSGLLWLCTFGLFGFGQLFDLVWIPRMVEARNLQLGYASSAIVPFNPEDAARQDAIKALLSAAESRSGKLSVTQAVMATGLDFAVAESLLKDMVKTGYVEVGNHPDSGVVLYEFTELS